MMLEKSHLVYFSVQWLLLEIKKKIIKTKSLNNLSIPKYRAKLQLYQILYYTITKCTKVIKQYWKQTMEKSNKWKCMLNLIISLTLQNYLILIKRSSMGLLLILKMQLKKMNKWIKFHNKIKSKLLKEYLVFSLGPLMNSSNLKNCPKLKQFEVLLLKKI